MAGDYLSVRHEGLQPRPAGHAGGLFADGGQCLGPELPAVAGPAAGPVDRPRHIAVCVSLRHLASLPSRKTDRLRLPRTSPGVYQPAHHRLVLQLGCLARQNPVLAQPWDIERDAGPATRFDHL
ncbi:hypothetical protein D3C80_1808950 [compost metagenome]